MKTTVTFCDFCDEFRKCNRNDTFSYDGKKALFDYLEEVEQSTGEEIELDVIALCCDYDENNIDDIVTNYSIDVEGMDYDAQVEAVRDYLQDNTALIGETKIGFIYAAF
jgi:hypothetical protein